MQFYVAQAETGLTVDVDAPSASRQAGQTGQVAGVAGAERAGQPMHAATSGSPVAACGVPVVQVTAAPWPPASEPACDRCEAAVAGYVM